MQMFPAAAEGSTQMTTGATAGQGPCRQRLGEHQQSSGAGYGTSTAGGSKRTGLCPCSGEGLRPRRQGPRWDGSEQRSEDQSREPDSGPGARPWRGRRGRAQPRRQSSRGAVGPRMGPPRRALTLPQLERPCSEPSLALVRARAQRGRCRPRARPRRFRQAPPAPTHRPGPCP